MRYIAAVALALVLLGCIGAGTEREATKEDLGKQLEGNISVPSEGLVKASGDGNVAVVTIKSANESGRMLFPMEDYPGRFLWANIHSASFVQLNKSHISWLDDDESLWLTIYRGNGSGVLFNAVYEKDVSDCGSGPVRMLGKEYKASELRNGSAFLFDDKWKLALKKDSTCLKRVLVYLDGYFDGIIEGEQLSLFRNDNAILLEFVGLDGQPEARIVATKPAP